MILRRSALRVLTIGTPYGIISQFRARLMALLKLEELEQSAIVANCNMNRERDLAGSNGYETDLRLNPLEFLTEQANDANITWLDLCCGSSKALIQAATVVQEKKLSIKIIGVDLVNMFLPFDKTKLNLELIAASLSNWSPDAKFDLITCVHGLHYVGDKVDLLLRARSWLKPGGKLIANLDPNNLKCDQQTGRDNPLKWLRENGFDYSAKQHLIMCNASDSTASPPFDFVGADDQAGPNYTGQPAVNSHYRFRS